MKGPRRHLSTDDPMWAIAKILVHYHFLLTYLAAVLTVVAVLILLGR